MNKCPDCKHPTNSIRAVLTYWENGKPIFRYICQECEKEWWDRIKEYLIGEE